MDNMDLRLSKRLSWAAILCALIAYIAGLFVDIMPVDAGQYAHMSMEMLQTGNILEVTESGRPYLDKPPLIFWLNSLFFYLFGVSTPMFKLPSLLVSLLGVYATYRLGKLWYNKAAGQWAGLILLTCQAWFFFNNDVRTDAMLAGFTAFAVWQLSEYVVHRKWLNLIGGFAGIGFAMLAKGPMGLMLPAIGFGIHFLVQRQWRMIFHWQWLAGLLVTALVLLPMCIGLYRQWGWHGIEFFFWTQSFGRITGENVWDNNAPIYFLSQNMLWAFLPWTLLLLISLWKEARLWIQRRLQPAPGEEYIFFPAFLLVLLALSTSSYQLPHYVFVIFPYGALLCGKHLASARYGAGNLNIPDRLKGMQLGIYLLLIAVSVVLAVYVFPGKGLIWLTTGCLFYISGLLLYFRSKKATVRVLATGAIIISGANVILNGSVYPALLEYQTGPKAGREIRALGVDDKHFFYYGHLGNHVMDFYSRMIIPPLSPHDIDSLLAERGPLWVYTDEGGLNELQSKAKVEVHKEYEVFVVQKLTLPFVNPATREEHTMRHYLLKLNQK